MKKIRQILIGLFNMVYNIFLRYSQAVLLVIVVIVSTDVFCRNVLSYSIKWAQEVSLLLIVWMTFLSMKKKISTSPLNYSIICSRSPSGSFLMCSTR